MLLYWVHTSEWISIILYFVSIFYKISQMSSTPMSGLTPARCGQQCCCTSLSVQRQQECGLSVLRQLNKVICLKHHETKSFSSPHHCLSTAFQVCVCTCVCVSGKILFSNQPSPWRWPAPWDLGPRCHDNQKVTWQQSPQTSCLHSPDEQRG